MLDEGFIYAATNGRINAAEFLVERGADVNGLVYETHPLHRAAWKSQMEMIA